MHALSLDKELTGMGWRVRVICLDSLPALVRYLPHLVEKLVNAVAMPLGFYYKGRVTRLLYRLFVREHADFYVFEDIYLSWNVDIPSVTLLHAVWSDNLQAFDLSEQQLHRLVRKEANVLSTIRHPVVTVSQPYRDYLQKVHFAQVPLPKRIEVVELGLDLDKFPRTPKLRTGRALIYCGTLEARKNVAFMLDVFERVAIGDPRASLTIVGDGPERVQLERKAAMSGLQVTFKGRLSHEAVISELQAHSIYLHTSVKESFSFALLEAKLCGLTTCALASLEVPEIFIDEGLQSLDADEWAARILAIDRTSRSEVFPDFSARRMVDRTLRLAGWSIPFPAGFAKGQESSETRH